MTAEQCNSIFRFGEYLAYFTWIFIVFLMLFQLFRQNFSGLKISFLYGLNSLSFFLAAGIVLKLAIIVSFRRLETKEESLRYLENECQDYFFDFVVFSLITVFILTVLNFLYLKYFVKIKPFTHIVVLFVANLALLIFASYISVINFYNNFSH